VPSALLPGFCGTHRPIVGALHEHGALERTSPAGGGTAEYRQQRPLGTGDAAGMGEKVRTLFSCRLRRQ
jgi:hypothetical protein